MILDQFKENPKRLFLFDCLGALLSALLYGLVLANMESVFGMPPKVLYILTGLALLYATYSLTCYLLDIKNWQPYLKLIAFANLSHCVLTVGLVFYYFQKITILGHLYFIGELIIVATIAVIELKTANSAGKD